METKPQTKPQVKPFENLDFRKTFSHDYVLDKINFVKNQDYLGLATQGDITNIEKTVNEYTTNEITNVTNIDFIYTNVVNQGAKHDGTTDDTDAINKAIMLAGAGGAVYFPPGVYRVNPKNCYYRDPTRPESGVALRYCFPLLYNDIKFLGTPYSVLKFMDGLSSDTAPLSMAMFAYNSYQTNVHFENLTFDFNDYLNRIDGNSDTDTNYTHTAIAFTGESGRGDDISFLNCTFQNNSGGSVILTSSATSLATYTLGKRWTIRDCKFHSLGTDSWDMSAIWGWCEGLTVEGCHFWEDTMPADHYTKTPALDNIKCACEIHGPNSKFINNVVENYTQMLWVAPNFTKATENVLIEGNIASPLKCYGVKFYRNEGASEANRNKPVRRVKIHNNTFVFTDEFAAVGVSVVAALTITDVEIAWNTIRKESGTTFDARGVYLLCQKELDYLGVAQIHDNIFIEHNYIEGMRNAIEVYYDTGGGIGQRIRVRDNRIKNCRMAVGAPMGVKIWTGLASGMVIDDAEISENSITNTDPVVATIGIVAAGSFSVLRIDGNHFKGLATTIWLGDIVAQTTKEGDQNP